MPKEGLNSCAKMCSAKMMTMIAKTIDLAEGAAYPIVGQTEGEPLFARLSRVWPVPLLGAG